MDNEIQKAENRTPLYEVLWAARADMAKRWCDIVYGTYPFDTIGFLRTKTDRFANPVGYRTEAAARAILDMLFLQQPDEEKLRHEIDEIMRVRSIQQFSPEISVGIFFALKDILRQTVKDSDRAAECYVDLLDMESRVDAVALMAFGAYARCRETLHQLRVDEIKRGASQINRLLARRFDEENE